MLVIAGATSQLSAAETSAVRDFLSGGGGLLAMAGAHANTSCGAAALLRENGVEIAGDAVVRTTYETYFHPKEVLVKDGVCNETLAAVTAKAKAGSGGAAGKANGDITSVLGERAGANGQTIRRAGGLHQQHDDMDDDMLRSSAQVVFPHATSLGVVAPARTLMDTGSVSYPIHRPIVAACSKLRSGGGGDSDAGGRLLAIGSCCIFEDAWLDKEDNNKLMEFAFKFLKPGSGVDLGEESDDRFGADDADVNESSNPLPETAKLAERLRSCLQESEELPSDFRTLFDLKSFSFNFNHVPEAVDLYEALNVKHTPLTLIPPQFETYVDVSLSLSLSLCVCVCVCVFIPPQSFHAPCSGES